MFKTRLQLNKESIIIIIGGIGLILLIIINVVSLVPRLFEVYRTDPKSESREPVDAETINKAIEYISP